MKHIFPDIESMIMGRNDSYKKVSRFIMKNKDEILFMTLDKMASEIGVSTTTVLRFARELGFIGYKDFQMQLRNEILDSVTVFSPYSKLSEQTGIHSKGDLLDEIMQCEIKNIQVTCENISKKMIDRAQEYFWKTKGNIYLCGLGSSFSLAYLAYTRFIPLKNNISVLYQDIAEIMDPLLSMSSNDMCFFFIFHRYNTRSVQILKEMYSRGVKTVVITDYPFDEIAMYCNVVLPCATDNLSPKNSLVGAIFLIDYLCAAFSFKDRQKALAKYADVSVIHAKYEVSK